MKKIKIYIPILLLTIMVSCKEEIPLQLSEDIGKLVIEGEVNEGTGPHYVKVSQSTAFNNSIQFLPYNVSQVVLSDNLGNVDTLTRRSDGIYQTHSLVGTVGNTYYLTVIDQGKSYTAQSTMPACPLIDSAYITSFIRADNRAPSVRFRDPIGEQNYYRYFSKINGKTPSRMFAIEDRLINGTSWRVSTFGDDLEIGDSVEFHLVSMDKANYDYFYILIQNQARQSGGNEEVAPTNPPSNISGNVLGYFSAHQRRTVNIVVRN